MQVPLEGRGVDKKYFYSPRPLENIYDPNFVQVDGKFQFKSSSSGSESSCKMIFLNLKY